MNKFINIILFISLISFNTYANSKECNPKKHAKLPNISEKTYHQARKLLILNQWKPKRTLNANSTAGDLGYGTGWYFWSKGYKEVEACAGTGTAPCVFTFKDKYGNILKVYTQGEEGDGYYARVSGYNFECK